MQEGPILHTDVQPSDAMQKTGSDSADQLDATKYKDNLSCGKVQANASSCRSRARCIQLGQNNIPALHVAFMLGNSIKC